ncbi:hypothetical protein ACLB2K_033923 [Fragaria x ananassa]
MPASSFGDKSLYRKVNFPFLQQVLEDESRIKFYVCNPSTGFFKQLPSPVSDEEDVVTYRIGVGYVSATDDYKVLVGYLEKDPGEDSGVVEAIQIFSLRAHCWKRIEEPGGTGGVYVSPSMALCNETLHWLSFERDQLFAFDLAKEELRTMPLPNFSQDGMNFGDIGVSHEGCLCVLRHCLRPCDSIDFWVMREYGVRDTWTKQFRLFNLMLSDPLDKPWKLIRFLVTQNSTFGWTDYTLARIDHKEEEKHGLYVVRGYPICITDYEESSLDQ